MLAVVRVTVQSVFKNYAAIVRISSDLVEISSDLVEISSDLVRISSELVSINSELLIISVFRKTPKSVVRTLIAYGNKEKDENQIFTLIKLLVKTAKRVINNSPPPSFCKPFCGFAEISSANQTFISAFICNFAATYSK